MLQRMTHTEQTRARLSVALAGNPNAGKSTIFNAMTGLRQHVGNWPGKTVERKTGTMTVAGLSLDITDLPGTYSLSAVSMEEIVTRDFLLNEPPDVILGVVDAASLERNLYLIVQLLELEQPLVVALNMMDVVEKRGMSIDAAALSRALGVSALPVSARQASGLEALYQAVAAAPAAAHGFRLDYGPEIESEIAFLLDEIVRHADISAHYPARWLAVRLLEDDADALARVMTREGGTSLATAVALSRARLEAVLGDDLETLIAERRYAWIHTLVRQVKHEPEARPSRSDQVDRVVTHRWLGIPIFMLAMWVVFKLTIDLSAPWVDWLDGVLTGPIANWAAALLGATGLGGSWVASLVIDGVLAGVGGVLAFVPILMTLYLALAIMEDSGYMARGAFVMDRLMSRVGLQGRSFLPLMVGFGCSVPAIYATRTLTNHRDRVLTGLLVPFMSCGARLPVYVLFASIFFPIRASLVILGLYVLGIAVALLVGLLLQRTLLPRSEAPGLVMELPPYRAPHLKTVWYHVWQRTRSFLQNAATLILATTVVIWLLMAIPLGGDGRFADTPVENSAFGRVSETISVALRPLGFGSWQAGGALLTGLVAKEVVVSTLAQTYGTEADNAAATEPTTFLQDVGEIAQSFGVAVMDTLRAVPLLVGINLGGAEEDESDSALAAAIRAGFSETSGGHAAAAGLAFMVFVLLYTPCMAAVAAARHELGGRWAWFGLVGQLALAWVLALVVFQVGRLLGVG